MIRTLIFLCLVLSIVTVDFVECKGGGGRGGGGRGGGGRSGRGGSGGSFGGWLKGLFGGGKTSSSHTYPASSGYSGHSSGGAHSYPSSNGLSGSGTGQRHGYPASTGLSGSNKYGQRYRSHGSGYVQSVPTYYTAPQYVYVTQYRNSGSRYNTLLTGLAFYNMGRMNSYHSHYYYQDSYYRSGSSGSGLQSTTENTSKTSDEDEATCVMRIKEMGNEKEDVLKIPCAIVTTFIDGDHKSSDSVSDIRSMTVCVNSTVDTVNDSIDDNDYGNSKNKVICKSTINATDPLSIKGPSLKYDLDMKCTVQILTKDDVISNDVDCGTLMKFAKLPVPENQEAIIMPSRGQLKDMLENPPWWLSLFFAV